MRAKCIEYASFSLCGISTVNTWLGAFLSGSIVNSILPIIRNPGKLVYLFPEPMLLQAAIKPENADGPCFGLQIKYFHSSDARL